MANDITDAQRERLVLLIEESGELIQAATKILRHGFDSCHPIHDDLTNRGQLAWEIGDILAIIELVLDAGDANAVEANNNKVDKFRRVKRYLHSSENIQRVTACEQFYSGKKPKTR